MTVPPLLNPNGTLLGEIEQQLRVARKTKPLWARRLESDESIATMEGVIRAGQGDYKCRGIAGEHWAQKYDKLHEKYVATGELDEQGFERFDPKPESAPSEAMPIDFAFRVIAQWGELTGNPHDYLVRSTTDHSDVWIVSKSIFEATYQLQ